MRTYRTAQVAALAGVHPNTVRLYEKLGLIPPAEQNARQIILMLERMKTEEQS